MPALAIKGAPTVALSEMLLHGQEDSDEGRDVSPLLAESFVALLLFGLCFILGDQAGKLGILLCKAGILSHCPPQGILHEQQTLLHYLLRSIWMLPP